MEIVHAEIAVMHAHGQLGNLLWKRGIRILIDRGDGISIKMSIRQIADEQTVNFFSLVNDAVVSQLKTRWRLKIYVSRTEEGA